MGVLFCSRQPMYCCLECFLLGPQDAPCVAPFLNLVALFHGWFSPSFFITNILQTLFLHSLPQTHHSLIMCACVHSDALKIAAIIGDQQNSTLLTAQPEANQKSSFAQHNSHPRRSNCSITRRLLFSLHCFSS